MKILMKTTIFVFCIMFSVQTAISAPNEIKATSLTKETYDPYKAIKIKLAAYPKSEDIDGLSKVFNDIACIDDVSQEKASCNEKMKKKMEIWLQAVEKIDLMRDPNFDPEKDAPSLNVSPPLNAKTVGNVIAAGMSPNAILDSKSRKQYEADIEYNNKKAERCRRQMRLQELYKTQCRMTSIVVDGKKDDTQYTKDISDLIDVTISKETTQEDIKKMFGLKPSPKKQSKNKTTTDKVLPAPIE